jgi:hypothetical protein
MAHEQKPDFVFRRNGRVHLNRRGRHFIRLLAAYMCSSPLIGSNAGCTMLRGSEKGTGYPLHSPVSLSLPLPCVTLYHHHVPCPLPVLFHVLIPHSYSAILHKNYVSELHETVWEIAERVSVTAGRTYSYHWVLVKITALRMWRNVSGSYTSNFQSNRRPAFSWYRYAPHNNVSVNDGPHIRRWFHNIII